jgi:hypothetical protein
MMSVALFEPGKLLEAIEEFYPKLTTHRQIFDPCKLIIILSYSVKYQNTQRSPRTSLSHSREAVRVSLLLI